VGLLSQETHDLEAVGLSQNLEKAEKVIELCVSGHIDSV
jgi:hypothetical protein